MLNNRNETSFFTTVYQPATTGEAKVMARKINRVTLKATTLLLQKRSNITYYKKLKYS
jgi:hypothetical protein